MRSRLRFHTPGRRPSCPASSSTSASSICPAPVTRTCHTTAVEIYRAAPKISTPAASPQRRRSLRFQKGSPALRTICRRQRVCRTRGRKALKELRSMLSRAPAGCLCKSQKPIPGYGQVEKPPHLVPLKKSPGAAAKRHQFIINTLDPYTAKLVINPADGAFNQKLFAIRFLICRFS